ncbi:MAG TPA: hypothetical protein VLW75_07565 [Rhizomicrobium sp.]|nr:hypothetical protein [Rhizomicrobium sp.]
MTVSKHLRTLALAGLGGIAIAAAGATAASAAYTYTRCDSYRCWHVRCDNDGDYCRNAGYVYRDYDRGHYRHYNRRWVCDRDGDDCHYVYDRGPHVGIHFGW